MSGQPIRIAYRWWQRRCTGRLTGPEIVGRPEWRCDLRRKHAEQCHFPPDDWPELAEYGGWRGLCDRQPPIRAATPGPTSHVRVLRDAGEVAQARAEARADFERVLVAATTAPPSHADLDRWYGAR